MGELLVETVTLTQKGSWEKVGEVIRGMEIRVVLTAVTIGEVLERHCHLLPDRSECASSTIPIRAANPGIVTRRGCPHRWGGDAQNRRPRPCQDPLLPKGKAWCQKCYRRSSQR